MKESYSEGLAIHIGPESCVAAREGGRKALTGVRIGQVLSHEINASGSRSFPTREKATLRASISETLSVPAWSETLCMCGNTSRENREVSRLPTGGTVGRIGKSNGT